MDHSGDDAWGALLLGAAFLLPSLVVLGLLGRWLWVRRTWDLAEATVTGHRKQKTVTYDNARTYRRVSRYRFRDAAGGERRGTGGGRLERGASILVRYDPSEPDRNEPARLPTPVLLGSVVAVPGVPLTLYALQWGLTGALGLEPLIQLGGS